MYISKMLTLLQGLIITTWSKLTSPCGKNTCIQENNIKTYRIIGTCLKQIENLIQIGTQNRTTIVLDTP